MQQIDSSVHSYSESDIKRLQKQVQSYISKKYGGWRVPGFDLEDLISMCVSQMVLKEMNPRYYKRYCSYTVIDTLRVASGHRIRAQGRNRMGRALKNTLTNTDIPVFDSFIEECRIYKELERDDWEQAIRCCQMLTEREKEVFVLYLCANRNLRHIGMIMQVSEARVCQILKGRSELVFDYLKRTGHLQHA